MTKADYNQIATYYDKGRPLLKTNISLWMSLIAKSVQSNKNATLLDIGCGTGRFALPFAQELDLTVTGADSSTAMLAKAEAKDIDHEVKWEVQDADNLTYEDKSFDYIFMSHLLHHVDNPARMLTSCYDIISDSGAVLIRYGALEQIQDDPEHRFFPGVREIDEARTPTVREVEQWLISAGFVGIHSTEVEQKSFENAESHYECASNKSNSVLSMITKDEFDRGLRQLREYINSNPHDPWLVTDLLTLTLGHKTG